MARRPATATTSDDDDEHNVKESELPLEPQERKRVLNILAQRRYRRRKKQRQVMLENMVSKTGRAPQGCGPDSPINRSRASTLRTCESSLLLPNDLDDWALNLTASPSDLEFLSTDPSGSSSMSQSSHSSVDPWKLLSLDADIADATWTSTATAIPNFDLPDPDSNRASPSLGDFLQSSELEGATFADDFYLEVSSLDLLRAAFTIATRLNCADRLWDLAANSPFHVSTQSAPLSSWALALPTNLQPTAKQLSTAHHPILDLLPWPSVRDKLIGMYALPAHFWPKHPVDGAACDLMRLVYDLEDGGVRLWGSDPAAEEAWEVGEQFLEAWWWALDRRVLEGANRRRGIRGESRLTGRTGVT